MAETAMPKPFADPVQLTLFPPLSPPRGKPVAKEVIDRLAQAIVENLNRNALDDDWVAP